MATNKDFIVKNGLSVGEDISVSGSVTSNLQFDDSVQAQFGTDSDLLIYHDNSNAYIDDVGAGSLYIRSGTTYFQNATGTKTSIQTNSGAGQTLYFNNDPIFATLVDGVSVTGNAVLTGELRGPASFVIDPAAIGDNTGEVIIKGDLTVEGTTTTINSTTLTVDDKNIVLGSGSANAAAADGAGISVDITGTTNPEWNWYVNSVNTGVSAWESNYPVVITQASSGRTTNLHLVNETSAASTEVALEMSVISPANDACDVRLVAHRRGSNAGSDFYIETTNSSNAIERHFTILEDGNVGIGVNLPTVALDVSGDITATGTITGADYSGITMGGSLSGSHDNAKVQYGNSFSGTPAQGHFFFDALNQKLKVYTGSAFVDAVPASGGGGGGSGSSDATATFRKYTYTLASSTNAVSGKEDDEVTTTNFISGRKYEITAVGNTDFTAIGASSNAIGVVFVSTGVGGGTTGKAKEVLFYATGGTQNIEVYVNGVKAVEGSSNDYVATTGTSVTFTSNLASGDVVDVQVYELLTNDSYYLKSEVYTQAQVNSQITTGTSAYLPLAGGELTGNLVMSGTSPQLQFETSASHPNFQIAVQESIASTFEISSGATDADATDDTYVPRLSVNANGRVGIGTGSSVPDAGLKVITAETGIAGGWIRGPNYGLRVSGGTSDSNYALRIANGSDAVLATFNGGGHLGINTTTPGDASEGAGLRVHKYVDRNQYYSPAGSYGISGGYVNNTNDKVWISVDSAYNQSSAESAGIFLSPYHGDANGFHTGYTIKSTNPGKALVVSEVTTAASTGNPAVETEVFRIDSGGSVFSTNNQPTIRPSLLLDFANSKSLDPTVNFTRSSTARYYDGYTTAKAGENLRKYSEDFTNAYWVSNGASFTSNQTAAPNGETTADKAIISTANAYHDAYTNQEHTNSGEYHTHSVYVKQGTGIPAVYFYTNVASGGSIAKFDITNGTYIGNASGNGYSAFTSHSVQDVGGGWYRISATYLETSSTYRPFTLGFSNTTADTVSPITGNGTDHFFVWGCQVERSNGPTEYVKTTTSPKYTSVPKLLEAPADVARFDHDPYTRESKGLLIESSRTNLLTESIVKSSYWYTPASLFDDNSGIAPDGTLTATTVYSNGSSNVHKVVGANAGQYYTLSVYAKKSDAGADTTMGVYLYASGTTNAFIQHTTFNLVTGEIANANAHGTNGAFSRIYPVGNGWYRLAVTGIMPAGISQSISSGIMYTPSQPNAAFLLWGAQLESSEFHTSYIPTSGSTVTRTQDNAKIENIDTSSWYSKGKGTTYVEAATGGFTTSQGFMSLYQAGYGNDWHGYYSNSPSTSNDAAYTINGYNVRYGTSVGGGNSAAIGRSNYTVGEFFKGAQTWNSESMSYAFDGLSTSDVGDRYVTEHNTLNFSQLYESGFHAQFVHIKKFAFYPEKMTETQVRVLTE